jgi:phosphate transport system substrate-binding protein
MNFRPYVAGFALLLAVAACDTPAPAAVTAIWCGTGTIAGEGSSAQAGAMNSWIRDYQIACPKATVAYDPVGSGAGRAAFIGGTGDFTGTDSPLTAAELAQANARCGGPAIHLPMVAGPVALAYTVAGAGHLQLRPATIARIFAGRITAWNDPAIAKDNPDAALPSTAIVTVHRSDSSGTTDNLTRFLAATAGADWPYGSGSTWKATGGRAEPGSNGVSATIAETDGAIGYVEWSYARFHNQRTASVANGADEFVPLTAGAAAAAVAGADPAGAGKDLQLALDFKTSATGAYPLVLVTYEVVCADKTPALVKSFFTYAVSDAGQAAAARLGYAPLPPALRARVTTTLASLQGSR